MINDRTREIISKDLKQGKLCHAYLTVNKDLNILGYLRSYAKLILCDEGVGCGKCRSCTLIGKGILPDCKEIDKQVISVEDVKSVFEEAYLKPIERDKKVFLISDFSGANDKAQNKLLKLLEEPPENVVFILGCSDEFKVLPTILSRVKKSELMPTDENQLIGELKDTCADINRLKTAVSLSGGYIEKAKKYYAEERGERALALSVLLDMKNTSFIPQFTQKSEKSETKKFVSVIKIILSDLLNYINGVNRYEIVSDKETDLLERLAKEYKAGAIVEILERLALLEKMEFYNENPNMVSDSLYFTLLEVKYKWQKL